MMKLCLALALPSRRLPPPTRPFSLPRRSLRWSFARTLPLPRCPPAWSPPPLLGSLLLPPFLGPPPAVAVSLSPPRVLAETVGPVPHSGVMDEIWIHTRDLDGPGMPPRRVAEYSTSCNQFCVPRCKPYRGTLDDVDPFPYGKGPYRVDQPKDSGSAGLGAPREYSGAVGLAHLNELLGRTRRPGAQRREDSV